MALEGHGPDALQRSNRQGNEPHFSKVMDLGMLVLPGGVERTEAEYHTLLADAGLRLNRILPTRIHLNILEAVKA